VEANTVPVIQHVNTGARRLNPSLSPEKILGHISVFYLPIKRFAVGKGWCRTTSWQEANPHARHGVFTVILLGENRKEKERKRKEFKLPGSSLSVCFKSKPHSFSCHQLASVARRSLLQSAFAGDRRGDFAAKLKMSRHENKPS